MARETNAMITFNDAIYMVANEGFTALTSIPANDECMTRSEIETYINADTTNFSTYGTNDLVPYQLLTPSSSPISTDCLIAHLDAGDTASYSGSGVTWSDISGNANHFTWNTAPTWAAPGLFNVTDSNALTFSANLTASTTGTIVMWMKTTDVQALFWDNASTTGSGGSYIGAYRTGNKEYHSGAGSPNYHQDTVDVANVYDNIRDGNWHMIEFKNVNLSSWSIHQFNGYSGYTFGAGTEVGKIMFYCKNLTPAESLTNFNADKDRYGATTPVPSELTITPTTQNVVSGSNSFTITATSNTTWSVSDNASWITISGATGSGNDAFTISVAENLTTSTRGGTVTVTTTDGTISRTCTVSQAAAAEYLTISPTGSTIGNAADSFNITTSSNTTWAVTDNVSWITISGASNSGDDTFSVSVAENITTSSRAGTVTVTGGGFTRTCTVTQDAAPLYLTITPTTSNVGSAAGNFNITTSSNTTWSVSDNASWITISGASNSGNDTFTVTYSGNTVMSTRGGTVTVTGGGITRTCTVSQAAAGDTTFPVFNSNGFNSGVYISDEGTSWLLCHWDVSDNVGVVTQEIFYREVGGSWVSTFENSLTRDGSGDYNYQLNGLNSSTSYEVYVRACDAAGNCTNSASDTRTTDAVADTTPPYFDIGDNGNLREVANTSTSTSLTIAWNAATDNVGVTGYEVFRRLSSEGSFTSITTVGGSTYTHTSTGLAPNTQYVFLVKALDAAGNTGGPYQNTNTMSTFTDAADTTGPSAVTLSYQSKTTTSISYSWTTASDPSGINLYRILWRTTGSGGWAATDYSSSTFNSTISGLSEGVSYEAYVVSKDNAGNWSASSNIVTITTTSTLQTISLSNTSASVGAGANNVYISVYSNPSWTTLGSTYTSVSPNSGTGTTNTVTISVEPNGATRPRIHNVDFATPNGTTVRISINQEEGGLIQQ